MRFLTSLVSSTLLTAALCSGAIPSTVQKAEAQAATQKTKRFRLQDYNRRYIFYTPRGADQLVGKRPLVVVLHGGGGKDRGMVKLTRERWNELADQHGFYVAYPNALDKMWDFGDGKISNELKRRVDDLAYFKAVIDDVSANGDIDQSRIFATGISRGGQASYYLACNMPERIRAVMPVTMPLPDFMGNDCKKGPPVGIAIMNGTADPLVPYDGGQIKVFRKTRGLVRSTDETVKLWRSRNKCSPRITATQSIDEKDDETSVDIFEWSDCRGAPVKLYRVNGGGHTWASGTQYLRERRIGKTSYEVDAADEGWKFFSQFASR